MSIQIFINFLMSVVTIILSPFSSWYDYLFFLFLIHINRILSIFNFFKETSGFVDTLYYIFILKFLFFFVTLLFSSFSFFGFILL